MAENISLVDAIGVVTEFDIVILNDLREEMNRRNAAYSAIMAKFPEAAKRGLIYQCAVSMTAGVNYQLDNLRTQYGLDQSPIAPVTTQ